MGEAGLLVVQAGKKDNLKFEKVEVRHQASMQILGKYRGR